MKPTNLQLVGGNAIIYTFFLIYFLIFILFIYVKTGVHLVKHVYMQ